MKKEDKRLLSDFYELTVKQIIDSKLCKKIWDMPMVKREEPITHILSILAGKSHVWIVNNLEEKKLLGVITRDDVLEILAPPRSLIHFIGFPKISHRGTDGTA
ncbi:MAG: CBS domain-containing protein, partial [Candidatus Thermoplasmatota archaeon]